MKTKDTLIIAEAGVNHNGNLETGKLLINAAAEAGADMVKFQTFSADRLVTNSSQNAKYHNQAKDASESQHAMISKLELSRGMHEELITHCNQCGIEFFSTGFDTKSIDMLVELGLEQFKIPSGEITNLPYLRHIGSYSKPVIISTGMANMGEIEAALEILETSGTPRNKITVLHCNTAYPTPMEDVNLKAMLSIGEAFGVAFGYSDHTLGIEIPIAAVALGATVIEKHFTLDRTLPGPDHQASIETNELKAMVQTIRDIEKALGDGIKRTSPSEAKNKNIARKSLVAANKIRAGDVFRESDLTVKRPGSGISPMRIEEVLGKISPRDFDSDELIEI